MKSTDLTPEDMIFGRLASAGLGTVLEIKTKWTLAEVIRAHQRLDLEAELQRLSYEQTKPKR